MKCKNCGEIFEGKYCNNCGQNARVEKINMRYLLDELPESVFQINHGFLFTVKELFLQPGDMIKNYIEGKRINYSKPIAYFILASAIYVLTTYLVGSVTFMEDLIAGLNQGRKDIAQGVELRIYNWLSSNQTYTILILLPFYSFASYLAFKKFKYGFTEHLVLNMYITAQQLIIYTFFSFTFVKDDFLVLIPLILGMLYNFWVFSQFFENANILLKILRVLLFYIYLALQILLVIIISGLLWKLIK